MAPLRITVRINDSSAVHIVMPRGRRPTAIRDDAWAEEDHPRGKGGKFSSGGSAHVVASHHPETGNIVIHGVEPDKHEAIKHQIGALQKQHAKLDRDYDLASHGHPDRYQGAIHSQQTLARFNQPYAQTKGTAIKGNGDPNKGLHIVAEGHHGGGLTIHGAYTDEHEAKAHAERLSKEAWAEKGETRSEVTQREVNAARREYNQGKPAHQQVSAAEADAQSHEGFEKYLNAKHPLDEVLPHPGRSKANRHFVENHLSSGPGMHEGRTGVIRTLHHKPNGT